MDSRRLNDCLFFMLYVSEKAIGFTDLLLFAFCKYNGGRLMERVMVGRVCGKKCALYGCVFLWRLS